jgi:hypothetical protein
MLSDEEKAEFVRDGRDPARKAMFRNAEKDPRPPMSFEQYLQWLADMERWSPAPPPSDIKRYTRLLL